MPEPTTIGTPRGLGASKPPRRGRGEIQLADSAPSSSANGLARVLVAHWSLQAPATASSRCSLPGPKKRTRWVRVQRSDKPQGGRHKKCI